MAVSEINDAAIFIDGFNRFVIPLKIVYLCRIKI